MISRRNLLTGATLLAASAAIPRVWAQAPRVPSSSIPCPMRRPRTSRISMLRPWSCTMASIMRPMSTT
ncbi:twin-arginine translocation signal domain-containing protein [Microvirga aerilata]|uniref:twin-arginine translocation signal domain-containing protein n=1 Tax=Microvirga aerilata TaxID=670292 RepID=UPI00363DFCA3